MTAVVRGHDTSATTEKSSPSLDALVALVALTIVRAYKREWVSAPVSQRATAVGLSRYRVSRITQVVYGAIVELVRDAIRRGRPRSAPPTREPRTTAADALLEVVADVRDAQGTPKRVIQDRLVQAQARVKREEGITQKQFCSRLKISPRTFRSWATRGPAPIPPPPAPAPSKPQGDPNRGLFDLEEFPPGVQVAADTTSWELFNIPLKVIAVHDPGNRDRQLWNAFDLDVTEDAGRIVEVVAAAVKDRPGLQLVTDQGRPYCAAEARAGYERHAVEHAPAKEGAPTRKATLERSFKTIKSLLAPLVTLTGKLADECAALRNASLARILGKYVVALALDAHRLGLESSLATTRTIDIDAWEQRAAKLRDDAINQNDSRRIELERLHDEYRMPGSRESFVNAYRRHALQDIQEAERCMRQWTSRCECGKGIRRPDLYFAAILRKVAEEGRQRRAHHRRVEEEARRCRREIEEFERTVAALDACPGALVEQGLEFLAIQWLPGRGELLLGGRGPGLGSLRRGMRLLYDRLGATAASDTAEVAWTAWEARAPGLAPALRSAVRRLFERTLAEEVTSKRGFTLPPAVRTLTAQSPPRTPRSPAMPLRN